MAYTPARLAGAGLTTTLTTVVYTSTGVKTIVKQIVLAAGGTGGNVTVAVAGNKILDAVPIAANAVMVLDLTQVLNSGETLTAGTSAGTVTLTASGVTL